MPEKGFGNFSVLKSQESRLSEDWERLLRSAWEELKVRSRRFRSESLQSVQIKFYPYRNGNNSILYKKGILFAKFHSSLLDADSRIPESLAYLLLSRLFGLKPEPRHKEDVMDFLNSLPERKNTKQISRLSSKGKFYDLSDIMNRIIQEYFPKIDPKLISIFWSDRIGTRRLGSYEKQTMSIRISPVLDHPKVPSLVIEHVVHHEILHHILPVRRINGKNSIHSPQFKVLEKRYVRYREAINWLKKEYPNFLISLRKENRSRNTSSI
ncbi:M48 family peptidase [Leptospira semungkisensis]|uniref:M48 family peptidase n=1 Tax=Leptospira semungkisensis TaxID=2484985 RepID=A0A4R9FKN9_9LEPT|nr:SprT-like domain-containing protein [Leptospira semungkisensis]TGJ99201.1 M48 family peptidase [Leptospira semungkisensis]